MLLGASLAGVRLSEVFIMGLPNVTYEMPEEICDRLAKKHRAGKELTVVELQQWNDAYAPIVKEAFKSRLIIFLAVISSIRMPYHGEAFILACNYIDELMAKMTQIQAKELYHAPGLRWSSAIRTHIRGRWNQISLAALAACDKSITGYKAIADNCCVEKGNLNRPAFPEIISGWMNACENESQIEELRGYLERRYSRGDLHMDKDIEADLNKRLAKILGTSSPDPVAAI